MVVDHLGRASPGKPPYIWKLTISPQLKMGVFQGQSIEMTFLSAFSRLESLSDKDTVEEFVRQRTMAVRPGAITGSSHLSGV